MLKVAVPDESPISWGLEVVKTRMVQVEAQ